MPGPPKKTSPIEPIMLWGFCFSTQAKQKFNTPWGAAWLTNQYTDERHEMWQHIDRDDILKKREIKYGNNIAVLFGALLECRSFWGRDGFWHAIARGFNTNATILRCTVEILTDARRIQRGKPAKEISETARAADRWISFLDNEALRQKPHRAGEAGAEATLNRVADAYFKKQEKSWVNAAWVPINPNREFREAQHTRPSTPIKSEPNDARVPQPRSAQMRKRSPSPSAFDSRSPKVRRMSHISGSGDIIPPTGPRGHPSRDHFDFAIYKDAEYPSRDIRDWDKNWDKDRGRDLLPPLAGRREDDAELRLNPSRYANGEGDYHRDDLHHNLKARIVSLEKELAQTKNKLATQPPPPPTTGTATAASATSGGSEPITNGNSSTSNQLDKQMNSVTDAVSTMMESMHDIVDGLTRLQDEVSTLSSSKDESCQTHPVPEQVMNDSKLEPTLTIISDTLKSLQSELSELKEQQKQAQPPTPPQIPSSDLSELKSILKQQSEQISALTQTVTRLQRQSPSMAAGSGSGSGAGRQTPQTLQQAITNAERDLWHHYSVVSDFYHKLDINTTSRASTERTAEFLAVLQHSFETAKGMSGSPLP